MSSTGNTKWSSKKKNILIKCNEQTWLKLESIIFNIMQPNLDSIGCSTLPGQSIWQIRISKKYINVYKKILKQYWKGLELKLLKYDIDFLTLASYSLYQKKVVIFYFAWYYVIMRFSLSTTHRRQCQNLEITFCIHQMTDKDKRRRQNSTITGCGLCLY